MNIIEQLILGVFFIIGVGTLFIMHYFAYDAFTQGAYLSMFFLGGGSLLIDLLLFYALLEED